MTIDICKYELKAKRCPQTLLADVFVSLLELSLNLVKSGQIDESRLTGILSKFDNPIDIKATVKRKAPAKKKAVVQSKISTSAALMVYNPFFWVSTSGSPPSLLEVREELLPLDCREWSSALSLDLPGITATIDAPSESVYFTKLNPRKLQLITTATKYELKSWFLKAKERKVKAENEIEHKPVHLVRPSMLGPAYAQKFGILIFTLKKACGNSIDDIERSILSCSLGENEVGLLAESLQTALDNEELKAAIVSIDNYENDNPDEPLYEDERFLKFIMRIPNVCARMNCLYVAARFCTVSAQLRQRMENLRTALDLLITNPQIHFVHQLVLAVGNELNLNNATRSGLKYFRLSTFDKLSDMKGKDGISLATYLSHFLEQPVFENAEEQKFLSKVGQLGILNTFNAVRDLLNTYMILAGAHKLTNMIPRNSPHFSNDAYESVVKRRAQELLPEARQLAFDYWMFLAAYTSAAYFFGDPNTLLPLDQPVNKADDEGGVARDLIQRYLHVAQVLKPVKRRLFELSLRENEDAMVEEEVRTERIPVTPAARSARNVDCIKTEHENAAPSQKRVKKVESAEPAFAPAVYCPPAPSSRRIMTLRSRMGARAAVAGSKLLAPPPLTMQPMVDSKQARSSISNSYSLARDLENQ